MHQNWIGGAWVGAEDVQQNINPSDITDVVGDYVRASHADAEMAIGAAHQALPGWSHSTPQQRADALDKIGHELLARKDELGELLAREEGKTRIEAIGEVARAGQIFKFFAGEALRISGDLLASVRPGIQIEVTREPLGVIGIITPWNFPIAIPAWKIAPALAYGNCVVFKPADLVPGCAHAIAQIIAKAGIPNGVFNLTMGRGSVVGETLLNHKDVNAITFTGSVATGRAILHAAAENLTPATVELGGKSPVLIFEDCDVEAAIADAARAILVHGGQVCSAGSRVLVADALHDTVVAGIRERFEAVTVGSAYADVEVGPMVSPDHAGKVRAYIDGAAAEGARLVTARQDDTGSPFVRPALFADVTAEMTLAREEVFGPVLAVSRFGGPDEAVAMANASPFGLAAGIWTSDISTALSVARELEAGTVYVNGYFAGGVDLPFGGYKASGFGREKGRVALEEYTQVKSVAVTFAAR